MYIYMMTAIGQETVTNIPMKRTSPAEQNKDGVPVTAQFRGEVLQEGKMSKNYVIRPYF